MSDILLLCILGAALYGMFVCLIVQSIRGKNAQEITIQYSFPPKLYDMHLLRNEHSVDVSSKKKQ